MFTSVSSFRKRLGLRRAETFAGRIRRLNRPWSSRESLGLALSRRGLYVEEWPNGKAPSAETFCQRLACAIQPNSILWVADHPTGGIIGTALITPFFRSGGEASLDIYVQREWRRLRAGVALLGAVATHARRTGVSVIYIRTLSGIAAGEEVIRRLDGIREKSVRKIEADIHTTPYDVPTSRRGHVPGESADVSIQVFVGGYPSEAVARDIASLKQMVAARYGTDPSRATLEQFVGGLTNSQGTLSKMGLERWTVSAVQDGRCVGYSEYIWDPEEPEIITHADLAVSVTHRDGQLAARLIRVGRSLLTEVRPSIRRVRYARPSRLPVGGNSDRAPQNITGIVSGHVETRWQVLLSGLESLASKYRY